MKRVYSAAAIAALVLASASVHAQSATIDFENGNDNGFGLKFSNDASASFPIVNIGGSNRMEVARTGGFQEADRGIAGDAFFNALNAATANPSGYTISYDWYVDTSVSPGNNGTFLQLGTYLNAGSGAYIQDFPGSGKDVELNGTQLASGQVFSGTVTETLTQKYGTLDPGFLGNTFLRFGFIENGDGTAAKVYFDNITVAPVVPEPVSIAALGLAAPMFLRRRKA